MSFFGQLFLNISPSAVGAGVVAAAAVVTAVAALVVSTVVPRERREE